MILIGMFDSPFVRRVAVSMHLLDVHFEHRNWSVGKDFEQIRQYNPLGRVPTLVLPSGESLVESSAILDDLDQRVGSARALLPATGFARREALQLMSLAIGAAEKGVLQIYENVFRPEEKRHAPWVERCRTQMHSSVAALEQQAQRRGGNWLVGDRLTQADVTVACVVRFLGEAHGINRDALQYPGLAALSDRCEALPAFKAVDFPAFSAPTPAPSSPS
jgi:glutathione S-transferase